MRTDTDKMILMILTISEPTATVLVKVSPKPIKFDSKTMSMCPNVVVVKSAWREVYNASKRKLLEILKLRKVDGFIIFNRDHT